MQSSALILTLLKSIKSQLFFWKNNELVKELCTPAPDAKDLYFPAGYAHCAWKQFTTCLWKQFWAYWRSPGYNLVRLTFSFLTALLFGTIYWQQGTKINDLEDLLKMMGGMYGALLNIGINNCSSYNVVLCYLHWIGRWYSTSFSAACCFIVSCSIGGIAVNDIYIRAKVLDKAESVLKQMENKMEEMEAKMARKDRLAYDHLISFHAS